MQTKIKKWGNSLALRIPKLFALDVNLKPNNMVDISIDKGSIIITPISDKEYSLEKLLKGISKNNLHGEIGTGAPAGKEIWRWRVILFHIGVMWFGSTCSLKPAMNNPEGVPQSFFRQKLIMVK